MPTAFSVPARENLRECQQGPRAKQKELLERYEFREVPIGDPSDIQAGDHLIRKGRKGKCQYDHHMLCTEGKTIDTVTGAEHVKIIEYTGSYPGFSAVSSAVASKDLTVFGKIVERTYQVQEFLKKEILKVIWPDEIDCFPVTEVIERARSRKNEPCYDLLKNNCEHFVTWCKCGLNVSLQVESWYLWARDLLYSAFAGLYDFVKKKAFVPLLTKIAANASDEVAGFICENAESIGFGIGILLEAGLASYEIYKAFKYHNKTTREFWAKLVEIVAKAICRVGGGYVGSLLGPLMCPAGGVLSSFLGGALGAGLGHLLGSAVAWCFENYAYFDG